MSYIKAIAYYLPERVVTNEELVADFPQWTVEKIASKVGVNQRHVAALNETSTDMAVAAAEKLFFSHAEIKKEAIDFVIFCTQTPDYILPTSACLIQHRLGLEKSIGAFDYNLGCSGYVYGLAIAKSLVVSEVAHNVLLLTAETYNKHIHPRDKGNRTIFGDAASATIVSNEGYAKIGEFALGTDGSGANNLIVKTGGARNPEKNGDLKFDKDGNPLSSDYLYMNGGEILSFTQENVPKVVSQTLERNGLTKDDIDLCVFHQANKYMLDFLRMKLKVDKEKFYVNMSQVGNTVSNSIPIALCDAQKENKLHGNILLSGFGVGYSWAGVVITTGK